MNTLKTGLLFTILTLLLIFIGRVIGGPSGMVFAFVFALIMNGVSYWFSDRIVLAMYRAREVFPDDFPLLHNIVSRLSRKAGTAKPRVYLIPSSTPNAFATGRGPQHSAVAVTQGILDALDPEEIEGVLAHEMAHIKNRDILIGSVVATIAGAISMLAYLARFSAIFGGTRDSREKGGGILGLLVVSIVTPIVAMLIQMAISRTREYQADASGARLSGNPRALASALRRLSALARRVPLQTHPSTSHMFIVNPLTGKGMLTLFSTHPPLEKRISALERLAR